MSEAEILKVLQKMKDKELADLIRSHISDPNEIKLILIFKKLGVNVSMEKINGILTSTTAWYETDEYEEKLTILQIGGIIINGILYVLELIINHHEKTAKIQLKEKSYAILHLTNVGDLHED
jgi:hypothetical protein